MNTPDLSAPEGAETTAATRAATPAASPAESPAEAAGQVPEQSGVADTAPARPVSRYAMGSVANLARSMAVILLALAVLYFIVPRPSTSTLANFDVSAVAQQVKRTNGPTVSIASGLPKDWGSTSARYVRSKQNLMMWQATYLTPDQLNATIMQVWPTSEVTERMRANWIQTQTGRGKSAGTVTIAGKSWERVQRDGKEQQSLVRRSQDQVDIVTGTASFEQLELLAQSLKPYAGS